jgi:protein-L-isoaspartate(D-aspartate) O-methyltransferase
MRADLVRRIATAGYVKNERVLEAMGRVPRHLFLDDASIEAARDARGLERAYGDWPLPIGAGQTISQPSVVGMMTEALDLHGTERVLEIGTGSGYQAAVLSLLAASVYTIEIVPALGERATKTLGNLGYANVHVRIGDGYTGWPEEAPFDRVILTAAPPRVPQALLDQLAEKGILVAPVGEQARIDHQDAAIDHARRAGVGREIERLERGLARKGDHVESSTLVGDLDPGAEAVEHEAADQVGQARGFALQEQPTVQLADQEVEEIFSLRRQEGGVDRARRPDLFDVVADKPLEKVSRLLAGDADDTPVRQAHIARLAHLELLSLPRPHLGGRRHPRKGR